MSFLLNPFMGSAAGTAYTWPIPDGHATMGAGNWTTEYGGTVFTTTPPAHWMSAEGVFVGGNESSIRARHLYYDIPLSHVGYADLGNLRVELDYRYSTLSSDADYGVFFFRFYSGTGGTGDFLGYQMSSKLDLDVSTEGTFASRVPAGTRSINIGLWGRRSGGTELSFYWQMHGLNLFVDTVFRSPALFSDMDKESGDASAMISGWTVTVGNIASTAVTAGAVIAGYMCRFGGSQAQLAYHKAISIPAIAASPIALGVATARLKRTSWRTNAGDRSRTYCQFLDSGDNVVATLEDASTPQPWVAAGNLTPPLEYTVALPSNVVSARMGFHFQRNDGTVNDADVALAEVTIEW